MHYHTQAPSGAVEETCTPPELMLLAIMLAELERAMCTVDISIHAPSQREERLP